MLYYYKRENCSCFEMDFNRTHRFYIYPLNSHSELVCKLLYFTGINFRMNYLSQAFSNFDQVCKNRTL